MLAEVMKIPDPTIDPATSIVASVRVIALTNPVSARGPVSGVMSVRTAELVMRQGMRNKRQGRRRQRPTAFCEGIWQM
jgi:hypothetical protein